MSENDRPLYVDSKKYYISCISLYVFSETNGTAQLLAIFTDASVCDGCLKTRIETYLRHYFAFDTIITMVEKE